MEAYAERGSATTSCSIIASRIIAAVSTKTLTVFELRIRSLAVAFVHLAFVSPLVHLHL